ncbi:MAG TPA: TraR/DksA C4-type zinc finger protein [Phycisphaerales bacterium]|nr:TraR/DksA C4-type zinc finger protein [Phycisphaerales bacterium]
MAKSGKPSSGKTKPAAKPAAKAKAAKPKPARHAPAKPAPKKSAKPAKPASKVASKVTPKGTSAKGSPAPAKGAAAAPAAAAGQKVPPKGITIVTSKPIRKPKPKKLEMPVSEPLIKPGNKWKPLIQSGPKAPPSTGIPGVTAPTEFKADPKAKLPKKELDRYREILLRKRNELIGDVAHMEDEALRQNSGSLSNLPQHMAEQGSDTCEQSLSLDLAQVDRRLIKEIDEAIRRIDDGTYGICLRTGKRISADRLAEVPWAKYTIEAAREMERTPFVITARPLSASRPSGGDED